MKRFIHEDFLLETDVARELYHEHAKAQPVIDYHCHLPPEQIAGDKRFRSMTELWLAGDHYKWRAMRSNGVDERFCTGAASDWEKFFEWAKTVPYTLRNPLYHWTHMELARPFGIDVLLNAETARSTYDKCNALLEREEFSACGLLRQFGVVAVCTTDDPTDGLSAHIEHAKAPETATRLLPTWRPDRALAVEDPTRYAAWLEGLEAASGMAVGSYSELLAALESRHRFFHEVGCRLSDHGLDSVDAEEVGHEEAKALFARVRAGHRLTPEGVRKLRSALLYELALMNHERGWVQQLHIGAQRNNNTRMHRELGPDTGFDCIGDENIGRPLARLLDRLDATNQLAKTIVYNINPRDNELVATLLGSFQDGSIPGKMQYGTAWWFLDQLDGMEKQLEALSNMGLLARFVGMTTDSRSFLSYSRHDYFRRLFCDLLGRDVARGRLPDDRQLLGELVKRICFQNARDYFGLI